MAEEVIKELRSFGLLENEAQVYLYLTRAGACPVSTIARRLGTNRMSVYRTLKTLEEKGLLESTMERPSRFVALPVINFLNRRVEESKANTTSLERSRGEIVDYYEHQRRIETQIEEPKFRIIQGRKHIHDQIFKMLDKAKTETCIIQTRNGLYRFIYRGIDDKLKELSERGVDVMILTHFDESGAEVVKSYLGFAQVRDVAAPSTMRLALVDETEALTTFARDDSMSLTTEKELAMWIRAPDYVKTMKVFFEALWKDGVLARQKLAATVAKQTLRETLDFARKTLEANGWTTSVPGKLTGESGAEHAFDLVAKYPDQRGISIVVDLFSEHGMPQILALGLKVLDAKPTLQLLVTTEPPSEEECEIATRHGAKLIYASKSHRLAAKIANEANKILKSRARDSGPSAQEDPVLT